MRKFNIVNRRLKSFFGSHLRVKIWLVAPLSRWFFKEELPFPGIGSGKDTLRLKSRRKTKETFSFAKIPTTLGKTCVV